ncbi:MAG: GNAT family N-acetyltransferase [Rhodobacteraceae bacterium]|nr:GNAT family N-acetyltransferase [Paracoccaceae bacterium]
MSLVIRPACAADAVAMSAILTPILKQWQSKRRGDAAHILAHYITHPDKLCCHVADAGAEGLLGFQALNLAGVGNPYNVPPGWGFIGTYVRPGFGGRGIGRQLFAASSAAASAAGIVNIDATIGADNASGLAYYAAMGFETYKSEATYIRKRFGPRAGSGDLI